MGGLKKYKDEKPFILSGGIGVEDIPELKKLELPKLYSIDINSRMETAPAMKDTNRIQHFINELKKCATIINPPWRVKNNNPGF